MSRRKLLIPTHRLEIAVPQDLYTKLTLLLFSDLEGRVPYSAHQNFFSERLREFFVTERLDLAPFSGCPPGVYYAAASPAAMEILKKTLKGEYV